MFAHSLESIRDSGVFDRIVLLIPRNRPMEMDVGTDGESPGLPTAILAGGMTRQESVRIGLQAAGDDADVIVCHDAARPFASPGLFAKVVRAVGDGRARPDGPRGIVPAVASPDTVKLVSDGLVLETLPRNRIAVAQTPQAFDAGALRESHRRGLADGVEATDDAMLLEAAGFPVAVVDGEPANFKVTTPDDLLRAERYLASRPA